MAKKKKKKQKQKVKSNFQSVMGRGTGGAIVEQQVGMAEAMTEFGDPIMDFLAHLTNGPDGPNMDALNNCMQLVQIMWNGTADNYSMDVLDSLKGCGRIGEMFDWDILLPAMYERHKQMFPTFHDPEQKGQETIVMHLIVEPMVMYDYLSKAIMENFPSEDDDENGESLEIALERMEEVLEENPDDVSTLVEYGRALVSGDFFDDAMNAFSKAYELTTDGEDKHFDKMLAAEILDCLDLLKRELSDFPWRNQPVLVSAAEFEQKMFAHLVQNGGRVNLLDSMDKILGSKHLTPGSDNLAQVIGGSRMRMCPDTPNALEIILL